MQNPSAKTAPKKTWVRPEVTGTSRMKDATSGKQLGPVEYDDPIVQLSTGPAS